jgi:hypothetical protein
MNLRGTDFMAEASLRFEQAAEELFELLAARVIREGEADRLAAEVSPGHGRPILTDPEALLHGRSDSSRPKLG